MAGDTLFGMKKFCLWMLVVGLLSQVAMAQTAKDSEQSFQDAILKKQRYLRGFSADPVVHLRWTGTALESDVPKLRTVGVFVAHRVTVKQSTITIDATRRTLLRGGEKGLQLTEAESPVEINVDLQGADPATALPGLADLIFYAKLSDALKDIPKIYQYLLPGKGNLIATQPDLPECDCEARDAEACQNRRPTAGAKPPRPRNWVEPEFSDKGIAGHYSGRIGVVFTVTDHGKVEDIWIASPAGYGLDMPAVEAVRASSFFPGTCHGKPASSALRMDIGFSFPANR